jgi:serine/threonine protein phosphatase 1
MACAISYGIDPARLVERDPEILEHLLLSQIPQEDIRFVSGFRDTVRFGDYLLVHAGIRPGVPIARQSGHDLRWIRGDFLNSDTRHEAMIVHGHTITEGVVRRPNRVGLDTGAYKTGILSAMRIEETETSFFMAGRAISG